MLATNKPSGQSEFQPVRKRDRLLRYYCLKLGKGLKGRDQPSSLMGIFRWFGIEHAKCKQNPVTLLGFKGYEFEPTNNMMFSQFIPTFKFDLSTWTSPSSCLHSLRFHGASKFFIQQLASGFSNHRGPGVCIHDFRAWQLQRLVEVLIRIK